LDSQEQATLSRGESHIMEQLSRKVAIGLGAFALSLASVPALSQVGPGYVPVMIRAYVCVWDSSTTLTLRAGPSRASRAIGSLWNGNPLQIINRFVAGDGMWWNHVWVNGARGYVRDDYVCIG
jgi:hypothetical protein